MQPAAASSKRKKQRASNFSELASQEQMCCGAPGPALPAFWGAPSDPARLARLEWGEEALNSAYVKHLEHTFLPLCLSPPALWVQLHQDLCCTPFSQVSQGPLGGGWGSLSFRLLINSVCCGNGTITPDRVAGDAPPGCSPCAGQGDATMGGRKTWERGERGRRLPKAPTVGKRAALAAP